MRIIGTLAIGALAMLASCAAPSQPYLNQARAACQTGNQGACDNVPLLEARVDAEHNEQARQVLLGIAAAGAGFAAGYNATHPVYEPTVVVVCRRHCW